MLNQTSLLACIVLVVILVTLIIFYSYKRIVNNEEEVARLTDKINAIENSQVKLSEFVQGNILQMHQQMVPSHQMMGGEQYDNDNDNEYEQNNQNYEHPEEGLVELEEEESEQTHDVLTLDDVLRHARETQETPEEEDVYNVDESKKIENNDEEDILEAEEYEPDDEDGINEDEQDNQNEEDNDADEDNETDEDANDDTDDESDEDVNEETEVSHHTMTRAKRGRKPKKSIKKKQLKQRGPKGRVPSTAPRGLEIGHRMRSDRDGQLYEVTETSNGRIRWMVVKENSDDTDDED